MTTHAISASVTMLVTRTRNFSLKHVNGKVLTSRCSLFVPRPLPSLNAAGWTCGRSRRSVLVQARRPFKEQLQQKAVELDLAELLEEQYVEEDEDDYESNPWDNCMDSVIKVYCVHCEPDFSMPWQRRRQYASTSTGFIIDIERRRLLTNAHSVHHYTQVKVKRRGDDLKYVAEVLALGTECDIAMLTVQDDAFWEGLEALELGSLPKLQESVAVVGYPVGGDTISVTSGVVSRIEVTSYVHGMTDLLGIQIDAAINSGNSGGPVFNDRLQCVGIAFQSLRGDDAENIGYVIPIPVVDHFLQDYERNQSFTGFPMLGTTWQPTESPALRSVMKMGDQHTGVLVRHVLPTAPASKVLKVNDVITHFEGIRIANDGTVPFRRGERIAWGYLISQKYNGETITLSILRDGKPMDVQTPPLKMPTDLIPSHLAGRDPSYFVFGGLVFLAVSEPFLASEYGPQYLYDSPDSLLNLLSAGVAKEEGQQVVVVSQVLANDVNLGYESLSNSVVQKVNGVQINCLQQLVEVVESCTEPFLQLDMLGNELVILETELARSEGAIILKSNSIPSSKSADLFDLNGAHDSQISPNVEQADNPDATLDEITFMDENAQDS